MHLKLEKTNFARSILLNRSYLMLLTCFVCLCIILCPWVAHGTKIITSSVLNICVCLVYVSFFRTLAFSTLKSKMHLILLDKKTKRFSRYESYISFESHISSDTACLFNSLKNESKMNPSFFNKLCILNMDLLMLKITFQFPRRFRPPLSVGNKIYRSLSFCSG